MHDNPIYPGFDRDGPDAHRIDRDSGLPIGHIMDATTWYHDSDGFVLRDDDPRFASSPIRQEEEWAQAAAAHAAYRRAQENEPEAEVGRKPTVNEERRRRRRRRAAVLLLLLKNR